VNKSISKQSESTKNGQEKDQFNFTFFKEKGTVGSIENSAAKPP